MQRVRQWRPLVNAARDRSKIHARASCTRPDVPRRGASRAAVVPVSVERGHLPRLPARRLPVPRRGARQRRSSPTAIMRMRRRRGTHPEPLRARRVLRGRGIGRALLELPARARTPGRHASMRSSRCGRRTVAAIRLYQSLGFEQVGSPARLLPGRRRPRGCRRAQAGPRQGVRADTLRSRSDPGFSTQDGPYRRDRAPPHVRDHFPPRRRQDHAHRKAAAVRRRDPARRHREGTQGRAARHLRLDAPRAAARHLRDLVGDAVPVSRTASSTCSTRRATRISPRTPTARSRRSIPR